MNQGSQLKMSCKIFLLCPSFLEMHLNGYKSWKIEKNWIFNEAKEAEPQAGTPVNSWKSGF